jgi:hypothetical protein
MGEWPTSGSDPNPISDTPMEVPAVRDQLWTAFRAPAMAYREHAPAPRGRWVQAWATVRRSARVSVMVVTYLGVVVALSLIVARVVHKPVQSPGAASTRQEQGHNGLGPHGLAQHQTPAAHKPPATGPVGTISPSPALSPAGSSSASSQPRPSQSASNSSPPSPTPTANSPSPTPSSPSPTPSSPTPTPTPSSPTPTPSSPTPTPTPSSPTLTSSPSPT